MQDKERNTPEEQVELLESEVVLTGFFHVEKLRLKHTMLQTGAWSPPLERFLLCRPDAVCAVVYHTEEESLLFVRQFRVGTFRKDHGWMTELAAGLVDPGESPEQAIRREIEEELGYKPATLQFLRMIYTTPGIIDERIFLYYAEVDASCRTGAGGGNDHEHEDLEIVQVPSQELGTWFDNQELLDAKTVIGVQWYRRSRPQPTL